MKILLTYSSVTGNTKKLADAIYQVGKEYIDDYLSVDEVTNIDAYDVILIGSWINKGFPNSKALELMKKISNKKIGYFFRSSI